MPEVFLSYRQTSDPERQRVRTFAERLRSSGITVIFDQFFLDDHPGGPNDGPGAMGKTTLAIRAAELAAPGHFDDILFLSAKQTAMDPQ